MKCDDFVKSTIRCQAHRQDGTQCSKRTARGNMCWQHAQQDGLKIKKSAIAGLGLFAQKRYKDQNEVIFKKGDVVAEYSGPHLSAADLKQADRAGKSLCYAAEITKDVYVDGGSTTASAARFINDPKGSGKAANVEWSVDRRNKKLKVKAKKNLQSGEEMLINYGRSYWAKK